MPPIPILILSILLLAWILPQAYTGIAEYLRRGRGGTPDIVNDPQKVTTARRNFYWALLFTIVWCLFSFSAHLRHSSFERGMNLLVTLMWLVATILRFRQWRIVRANADSYLQSNIISSPGK